MEGRLRMEGMLSVRKEFVDGSSVSLINSVNADSIGIISSDNYLQLKLLYIS
jgi:hypothetical protein